MELLFIALFGAIIGLVAHFALPAREATGEVLIPAISTAAAAIIWVVLTWIGFAYDEPWIWLITLVSTALTAVAANLLFARVRRAKDNELLVKLTKSTAV